MKLHIRISYYTGWIISSVTSFLRYKISDIQTIFDTMVDRVCNSKISMILLIKVFSSLRPGTGFCMASLVNKKCVLGRNKYRESGPLLSKLSFQSLQIQVKMS